MHFHLKPRVHAVKAGSDLVVLDVAADTYHCLDADAAGLRLLPGRRRLEGEEAAFGALLQAGLVEGPQAAAAADLEMEPALRSARRAWRDDHAVTTAHRCALVRSVLQARRDLKRGGLAALLDAARRSAGGRPKGDLVSACAAFERLRPWAPLDGACLERSYWQARYLRLLGFEEIRWVFGVRTRPFIAHCWLQSGDMALNDEPDLLVGFHPILVV